jgi:DNA-binding GntR family transcriptional regulator
MSVTPDKRTQPQHALATLGDEIVGLRLEPGALLERPVLQERFGVSSTPLHDALLRLADEGAPAMAALAQMRPDWVRPA